MTRTRLAQIAYARSGDKGSSANIGVIAFTAAGYDVLRRLLTADVVGSHFSRLGPSQVVRYELPNLWALNFVLSGVLGGGTSWGATGGVSGGASGGASGGGSRSLRSDAQGKALGQALLELELDVPGDLLPYCLPDARTQEATDG